MFTTWQNKIIVYHKPQWWQPGLCSPQSASPVHIVACLLQQIYRLHNKEMWWSNASQASLVAAWCMHVTIACTQCLSLYVATLHNTRVSLDKSTVGNQVFLQKKEQHGVHTACVVHQKSLVVSSRRWTWVKHKSFAHEGEARVGLS